MFSLLVEIGTVSLPYESCMDASGNADLRKQTEAAVSSTEGFIEFSCHESVKIDYVIWMFLYVSKHSATNRRRMSDT
jgi:hypothetical protein